MFAWKPVEGADAYLLRVARDAGFTDVRLEKGDLRETAFLPEEEFEPGRYFWGWSAGEAVSETFTFEVTADAAVVEVPPVAEWLRRLPQGHPRIYLRPEDVPALRESRFGERADLWGMLRERADAFLAQSHEIAEPPFLPDRKADYNAWHKARASVMRGSRAFMKGAQALALAYLASGEKKYARAACERMASISLWDPDGSSELSHSDEAHMSVIWHGSVTCDHVWDEFTDQERERVVAQFRRRGQITFEHMHGRGAYGVTRFDSHAGREVVFLALLAFVFHDDIPEAVEWLEWLRPVLCGIWPIWSGDDGAWAEGPAYGLKYVSIMTNFATALKRAAGVDLYPRPFWRNHAKWRSRCVPAYAEWLGFGDMGEPNSGALELSANLMEEIVRESGAWEEAAYVSALRERAGEVRQEDLPWQEAVRSQRYLAPVTSVEPPEEKETRTLWVFPAAGQAVVRTDRGDVARDVAFAFRSSPYAAVSHSHASNNDFLIHVSGKVVAVAAGRYCGYGSNHHVHWNWHTKSHNCLTLSDAGQIMRSHDSRGAVENAREDDAVVYFRGNADASYSDRALRCRRHVIFLKGLYAIVMIDEFTARPGIPSATQWNIHGWSPFEVYEREKRFFTEREGSSLEGRFMCHHNSFFSVSEGWDPPPPDPGKGRMDYNLRFTPSGLGERRNLGVVLCMASESIPRAEAETFRDGAVEVARIGDALIALNPGAGGVEYKGLRTEGLALALVAGKSYELTDEGLVEL